MLSLKYLDDNRQLMKALLSFFSPDQEQGAIQDHFRISSNAIYPFYKKGEKNFLRFAPKCEKNKGYIQGEIAFIEFLSIHGLCVPDFLMSDLGQTLVEYTYHDELYYATAMTGVPGTRLDKVHLGLPVMGLYGQTLARLHVLSKRANSDFNRPKHTEIIDFMRLKFKACPQALNKIENLSQSLQTLEISEENYGLVHYDYELDNAFFIAEKDDIAVIDFDDAHYHFYAIDLVKATENLKEHFEENGIPSENRDQLIDAFIKGYKSISDIPLLFSSHYDLLKAYILLYRAARMQHALETEEYRKEDWAQGLKKHFRSEIEKIIGN